ncbi:MAG: hypothetical protein AAGD10_06770 [Myxococcota bacterium]
MEGPTDDGLLDRLARDLDSDLLPQAENTDLEVVLYSHAADDSQLSVDRVLEALAARKGFRSTRFCRVMTFSGEREGCLNASPVELARRSGGHEASICFQDWSRNLEYRVQGTPGRRSRFFLSRHPVVGSLQVEVDGQPLVKVEPNGQVNWTYDASIQSLFFSILRTPQAGQPVTAHYDVANCRDD